MPKVLFLLEITLLASCCSSMTTKVGSVPLIKDRAPLTFFSDFYGDSGSGGRLGQSSDVTEQPAQDFPTVSSAVYDFGQQFLTAYRSSNRDSNIVFSPVSFMAALSIMYFGAAGETRELMRSTLGFQGSTVPSLLILKDKSVQRSGSGASLSIVNRAYVAENLSLKSGFLNKVGDIVENTPFATNPDAAIQRINGFVSESTNGLIPTIVSEDEVGFLTELVLVNAVYFKGTWSFLFPPRNTRRREFRGLGGPTMADFMTYSGAVMLGYGEVPELDSVVVELPYTDEKFSMYIVLPNGDDGWREVENGLANIEPMYFVNAVKSKTDVYISLPKWDLETEIEQTIEVLKRMGLEYLFSSRADFTSMVEGGLQLTSVAHKAKIKVSEEGTEAAAATAITAGRSASAVIPEFVTVTVDHPFLYYIVEKSDKSILFQGTVTSLP